MSYIPGNNEKGWNDPPQFLNSSTSTLTTTTASQPKNLLNKRISHNINSLNQPTTSTSQTMSSSGLSMPPTGATPPPSGPPVSQAKPTIEEHSDLNPNLEEIEKILFEKIQLLKDKGVIARTTEEIQKRAKLFSESWP